MRKFNLHFIFSIFFITYTSFSFSQNEQFSMRQLAGGLSQPWEIKFGPDGYLWVTEAHSYEITRIDPVSGNAQMLIDLSNKKNFPDFDTSFTWPQGGLQGMAFHPNFSANPYVYVAYVYQFDTCLPNAGGCFFKTKIVRYNYDMGTKTLSNETIINDSIPGSSDHNGGRLVSGPADEGNFLFYSVGDMGAGHLGNASREHHGQLKENYEGKILRFNLIPDGDTPVADTWIPNDNPFNTTEKQSAVWSLGHRNPQGLAFGNNGILYESEHGPYTDDEVNIIRRGHNYGFPLIMGFDDGNYDGSKAGAGSGLPMVSSEVANRLLIEVSFPYSNPIGSYFASTKSEVSTFYTNDINNTPPYKNYYLQYHTTAPSGIDFYGSDAIPGWKNSLLMTNLKLGNVYRLKLSFDGQTLEGDTIVYFKGLGRFRDIAISNDGTKIYVCTDTVGVLKGAPGEAVIPLHKGSILEFSYIKADIYEPLSGKAIFIYPNPVSESISVDLPSGVSIADMIVYNSMGQQIMKQNIRTDKTTFDIAWKSGVYFVELVNGSQTWRQRVVVK